MALNEYGCSLTLSACPLALKASRSKSSPSLLSRIFGANPPSSPTAVASRP